MRSRRSMNGASDPDRRPLCTDRYSVSWRPDFGHRWKRIKDGFNTSSQAWGWVERQTGKYANGLFMVVNNPERAVS